MEQCCNILTLDADALLPERYEIQSLFSTLMFSCCTLGMVFSITALILLLLTALLFQEWRKVYKNQLLLQFMISRFLFTLVRYQTELRRFVYGKKMELHRNYIEIIIITYTEVALVVWMFVFTKQMYDNFVKILFVKITLWKVSLAAWIMPIIVTMILFFTCVYKKIENTVFFMIYLLMAKWPVLLTNGILLIIVLKTILSDNRSKKIKNIRIVIMMIILILSFSFQQIFWDAYKLLHVLYRQDDYYFSPMFLKLTNILTVYQCAASIFFWLYGNKRTRVMWGMEKLIKKQSSITSVSTIKVTKL